MLGLLCICPKFSSSRSNRRKAYDAVRLPSLKKRRNRRARKKPDGGRSPPFITAIRGPENLSPPACDPRLAASPARPYKILSANLSPPSMSSMDVLLGLTFFFSFRASHAFRCATKPFSCLAATGRFAPALVIWKHAVQFRVGGFCPSQRRKYNGHYEPVSRSAKSRGLTRRLRRRVL